MSISSVSEGSPSEQAAKSSPSESVNSSQHSSESLWDNDSKPYQPTPVTIRKLNKLELCYLWNDLHLELCLLQHVPKGFTPPSMPIWKMKKNGEDEQEQADPCGLFSGFLNEILDHTRAVYRNNGNEPVGRCAMDTLFTNKFKFVKYDKPIIKEGLGPRLDIAGCILKDQEDDLDNGHLLTNNSVSWDNVVSFVVVKNRWDELVVDACICCQEIYRSQSNRVAVRFLLFDPIKNYAAIAESDRGGVYITRRYKLDIPFECERFSVTVAGMFCSSIDEHGFNRRERILMNDGTKINHIVQTSLGWLLCTEVLCDRNALQGRCTKALKLELIPRTLIETTLSGSVHAETPVVDEQTEEANPKSNTSKKRIYVCSNNSRSPKRMKKTEDPVLLNPKNTSDCLNLSLDDQHIDARNELPMVVTSIWNDAEHISEVERDIIHDIKVLQEHPENLRINGLPRFGRRSFGRVTRLALGAPEQSRDPEFVYTNQYKKPVSGF
jgi:hypothetical protein